MKKDQILDKLKSYSKTFKDTGNSEEYYNLLQSDFSMSPQGAASIAFEPSKSAQDYIKGIRASPIGKAADNSRKYAIDLQDKITRDDNFLSLAKAIGDKDFFFDQNAFFNQLREDRDHLSDIQNRSIDTGEREFFPNWGDLFVLPLLGGSK